MSFKGNVTAVLGGLAPSLGRKGTSSDVTLYNNKTGDFVLSFVEPSTYPEKIQSLISALNMAGQVLYKVTAIDPYFAETVVTLDCLGMEKGYLILGEGVQRESLEGLIRDSVLGKYETVNEQVMELRGTLSGLEPDASGDAVIQVDHSFNVKGVGTVVLGVVLNGTLEKYNEVSIYPSGKTALVKSIQVHDTDVSTAPAGVRVGLSLKNTKPEEVERGAILSTGVIETCDRLEVPASLSKYYAKGLKEGDQFMVNHALNHVPAKLIDGSLSAGGEGKLVIGLDRKIPILPGRRAIFLDPGQKVPRVFGFAEL